MREQCKCKAPPRPGGAGSSSDETSGRPGDRSGLLAKPVTTGTSGDTPVFMRVVTACTACHRIGDGGRAGGVVRLLAGVDRPAVPGSKIGELAGLEDVTPATPVPGAHLLAHDPERIQEAREPA